MYDHVGAYACVYMCVSMHTICRLDAEVATSSELERRQKRRIMEKNMEATP